MLSDHQMGWKLTGYHRTLSTHVCHKIRTFSEFYIVSNMCPSQDTCVSDYSYISFDSFYQCLSHKKKNHEKEWIRNFPISICIFKMTAVGPHLVGFCSDTKGTNCFWTYFWILKIISFYFINCFLFRFFQYRTFFWNTLYVSTWCFLHDEKSWGPGGPHR